MKLRNIFLNNKIYGLEFYLISGRVTPINVIFSSYESWGKAGKMEGLGKLDETV